MKSMRRTTVKNSALIILCDNSILNTFLKIYVIHTLRDKAIFACVTEISCCVIKQFSLFESMCLYEKKLRQQKVKSARNYRMVIFACC